MPQFCSVTQSCPILCDPMDCSMPGFPVHHQLLQLAQNSCLLKGKRSPITESVLICLFLFRHPRFSSWHHSEIAKVLGENSYRSETKWSHQILFPPENSEKGPYHILVMGLWSPPHFSQWGKKTFKPLSSSIIKNNLEKWDFVEG